MPKIAVLPFSRTNRTPRRFSICLLTLLIGTSIAVQASETTSLQGVVVDLQSKTPINGAIVTSEHTTATTDATGHFVINNIERGNHVVSVVASGYRSIQKNIAVLSGTTPATTFQLETDSVQLSDVMVTAPPSEAMAKFDDKSSTDTLTDSISDAALKNPNAQSTADYIKDVSGVAVSAGANGTSTVSVRGIDQRMLRITVDGQRQGGSGNPLDSIPADIVQSLEVTKTFTPDMEADAVGGVININTGGTVIKDPYTQGRHQAVYNTLAPHPGTRNSFTVGQPFDLLSGTHNASVLATLSFDDQYALRERISDLREWTSQTSPGPDPYTGESIPTLTLPVIESTNEHRQRSGLVLNSDARFGDVALFWRSNFSRDWAKRNRNIDDTNPAMGTPLLLTPSYGEFSGVPLSRRNQQQTTQRDAMNLSFGSKNKFGSNDFDATFAYSFTHETEPDTLDTDFLSDHTYRASYDLSRDSYRPTFTFADETNINDTASMNDPTHYRLNYLYVSRSQTDEQNGSLNFNLKLNLDNGIDYWKFGGKVQQRHRSTDADRIAYNAGATAIDMNSLIGASQITMDTMDYRFGPTPNAGLVGQLLRSNPAAFQEDFTQTSINSTTGDSSVTENWWALYGMGKFKLSSAWSLLGGVRVEGTQVHSRGNQMELDGNGDLQGFTPARAANSYVEVLPGLHLRYEPQVGLLYRGSITRSMSRPSNTDIAPYRTLSFIDHRSRIGAPDLKPYLSTNFDLSVDQYSERYGLLSAAVFYKKIDHFITDAQYPVTIGNLGEFIEFKRINGDAAWAAGVELSWQSPTWTLPWKLGRSSIETNYNFNHGEAHFPTRPGEVFPLPRQVDHQASLKLHETRGALTIDAEASYRSGWWEDQIARGFDNYITSAWDAQISGTYKIAKNTRITGGINNLLNRATRHYAGDPSRMNDWQRSGIDMNLGLQWKM